MGKTTTNSGAPGEASRGRSATRPGEIPFKGWKDILLRMKDELRDDNIGIVAAGVAFYGFLAIFPALAALVSIFGLIAEPATVRAELDRLAGTIPQGVLEVLGEQVDRVTSASGQALSLGVIVGLALTLFSANRGMTALTTALNIAYEEREKRGFFMLNAVSLAMTLGAVLLAIVALLIVVALPIVLSYVGLGAMTERLLTIGRWPLLTVLFAFGLGVLYQVGPSRERARFRWVSVGAIVGTLLWLAASLLFSWYVTSFGSYNETYGSVGAVAILLMWLFISAYAVLIGAELNAEMEHQTAQDTTSPPDRPMGERGAVVADTLGEARGP